MHTDARNGFRAAVRVSLTREPYADHGASFRTRPRAGAPGPDYGLISEVRCQVSRAATTRWSIARIGIGRPRRRPQTAHEPIGEHNPTRVRCRCHWRAPTPFRWHGAPSAICPLPQHRALPSEEPGRDERGKNDDHRRRPAASRRRRLCSGGLRWVDWRRGRFELCVRRSR
jgi:hypothetical protein